MYINVHNKLCFIPECAKYVESRELLLNFFNFIKQNKFFFYLVKYELCSKDGREIVFSSIKLRENLFPFTIEIALDRSTVLPSVYHRFPPAITMLFPQQQQKKANRLGDKICYTCYLPANSYLYYIKHTISIIIHSLIMDVLS